MFAGTAWQPIEQLNCFTNLPITPADQATNPAELFACKIADIGMFTFICIKTPKRKMAQWCPGLPYITVFFEMVLVFKNT